MGHVAEHVVQRAACDVREERIVRDLESFQVRNRQLRLVVEHFFEMRDEPALVHRITMKAAAELIVHAAVGHGTQGVERHVEGFFAVGPDVVAQQEIEHHRAGELGRFAETAVIGVKSAAEVLEGGIENGFVRQAGRAGRTFGITGELRKRFGAGFDDSVVLVFPGLGDALAAACRSRDARSGYQARKYVPPKNGLRSGVRKTDIGQPPLPVAACT